MLHFFFLFHLQVMFSVVFFGYEFLGGEDVRDNEWPPPAGMEGDSGKVEGIHSFNCIHTILFIKAEIRKRGTIEKARQLRALTAVLEVLSIPSTHIETHAIYNCHPMGSNALCLCADIHADIIPCT